MKRHLLLMAGAIMCSAVLYSCGGKVQEAKDTINNLSQLKDVAENMEKNFNEANEAMEERKAKGDTIAMHYEELAKYLPESIGDYQKAGDMDGGTTTMPGTGSFSNVSQRYEDADGNSIEVSIMDYNASQMMFMGVLSAYASGIEIDNTDMYLKGLELSDNSKGWQEYQKKSKKAKTVAGVANRFYIQVEADNQENTDLTNSVIKDEIEIDELENI